jgi:DNA-binding protein HU-beta
VIGDFGKGHRVNKAELVQALAERLDSDRKVAVAAVDGLLDVIVRAVYAGDSVSLIGFGVFERRERAARTARNPRTGQLIEIPATAVPGFRPGAMFRDVVSGARSLGEPAASRSAAPRPVVASVKGAVAPVPTATAVALATEHAPVDAEQTKPTKIKPTRSKSRAERKIKTDPRADAKAGKDGPATKAKAHPEPKPTKAAKSVPDAKADKSKKKPKK